MSMLPVAAQSLFRGVMRVEDCTMREEGDSLQVDFTVRVDREATRWFAGVLFTPTISDGDRFVAIPDIMLLGKNKNRAYERSVKMLRRGKRETFPRPATSIRVSRETDTLIHCNHALPYEMWMDTARLVFYVETFGFRNERTLLALTADSGVKLATRTPYRIEPRVNFLVPATEVKSRAKQDAAYLDFQANRTVILPDFRRNPEELAKIREAMREVQNEEGVTVTGMFIEGYASIEGSYENNTRLARDRAGALKRYIESNFRLPFDGSGIKVSWVPEDWDGLRALVERSDIAHREQILSIIDNTPVMDGRESALMRLADGVPYRTMLREMFPQGRRVEYRIDYSVRDFTVRETELLLNGKAHLLNHSELYSLAQSHGPGTEKYNEIMLEIIPRHYPDDATAAMNAAAAMILGGEYATARRTLEKFADDPRAWNNLGVLHMYDGDPDGAQALLDKAVMAGVPEASHNLEELRRKREDEKNN